MSSCHTFKIGPHNTDNKIKDAIDKLSKLPLDSTIDATFSLHFRGVIVTPPKWALVIEILNLPQRRRRPTAPPEMIQERKWNFVEFTDCTVSQRGLGFIEAGDNLDRLASSLARRVTSLAVEASPDILECLFLAPKLEMDALSIDQKRPFKGERMGCLILQSLYLKRLNLTAPCSVVKHKILVECLANVIHLQTLQILETTRPDYSPDRYNGMQLMDVAVRQGSDAFVGRLLQNPQSQLKELYLSGLDDCDFLALVKALPTSKLEKLTVANVDMFQKLDIGELLSYHVMSGRMSWVI